MFKNFKMKPNLKSRHSPNHKPSLKEIESFFKTDSEARKAVGLENLPGEYTFTCPNCGTHCKSSWHSLYGADNLHGRTDCFTCDIHLIV